MTRSESIAYDAEKVVELRRLVRQGEGQYLEFKRKDEGNVKDWHDIESLKTVCKVYVWNVTIENQITNNSESILEINGLDFGAANNLVLEKSDPKFPPLLKVKENSISFIDADGNNRLDAGEEAIVKFAISNSGKGPAKGLKFKYSLTGTGQGIKVRLGSLPVIEVGKEYVISVTLNAGMDLLSGEAKLNTQVTEPNGLDAPQVEVEFATLAFQPPSLVAADGVFSSETGGNLRANYPASLLVVVQNTGVGVAQEITTEIQLPQNVLNLGETAYKIPVLKSGESSKLNFDFIVNARYSLEELPIKIILKEKYGKFGSEKTFVARMNQSLAVTRISVQSEEFKSATVIAASLHSDVDRDIPINLNQSTNRFALVIGNEDYKRFQTGLQSDQNVAYARNDAAVFKEYLTKTLGFTEKQIFMLTDATRGQMSRELERITELVKLTPGAELIFYYAGHGLPDFETRQGYLIPVDVTASSLKDAISLKDLYSKLASSKASKILVFLDACFSGGGRGENGLLAARTVKVKPKGDIVEGNIVAFTATSGEEVSLPLARESHGLFTYYLLRKLKETKGNVTLDELRNYLEAELPKASLIENSMKQTPQVLVAPDLGDKWLKWKLQ